MFEISERKKLANNIFRFFERILLKITDNNSTNGYIVAFFHYSLVFITFMLILSKHIAKFFLGCFLWTGIVLLHTFFNGCIFIRMERYLWKTKTWYGPWQIPLVLFEKLFNITPKTTPNLLQYLYIVLNIIVYGYIGKKLHKYFSKKDDELKNISHKESHLESLPNDLEYPHRNNDQQFLEIKEQ